MRRFAVLLFVACGGTTSGNADSGTDASPAFDSGRRDAAMDTGADVDNGMPSDMYPFPHPPLPQIVNLNGPVMTAPKVIPILYATDGYKFQIKDFLGQLATSNFWG